MVPLDFIRYNSRHMKILLSTLLLAIPGFASADDSILECQVDGLMHGPVYVINSDFTMTVEMGAFRPVYKVENSRIKTTAGKITYQESTQFAGEKAVTKTSTKGIVRISEATGNVVLVAETKPKPRDEDGYYRFDAKLLKGALTLGEGMNMDTLNCFNKTGSLNFKR